MTTPFTLDWVREQLAASRARTADLEAMERVMSQTAPAVDWQQKLAKPPTPPWPINGAPQPGPGPIPPQAWEPQPYGAKKRAMFEIISRFKAGLATAQIANGLIEQGFEGTSVANTSAQLSGYRADGLLSLDGGLWSLTDDGRAYLAFAKE